MGLFSFCQHTNYSGELSPMYTATYTCNDCGATKVKGGGWSHGGNGLLGGLLCWLFSCNDNTKYNTKSEKSHFGFFERGGGVFFVLFLLFVVVPLISKCSVDPKTDSVDIKTDSVDIKTDSVDPKTDSVNLKYHRVYIHSKSGVNIRSGPGTSYGIQGTINRGDKVYIDRSTSDKKWVRVFMRPPLFIDQGYVFRPLLHLTK